MLVTVSLEGRGRGNGRRGGRELAGAHRAIGVGLATGHVHA